MEVTQGIDSWLTYGVSFQERIFGLGKYFSLKSDQKFQKANFCLKFMVFFEHWTQRMKSSFVKVLRSDANDAQFKTYFWHLLKVNLEWFTTLNLAFLRSI